MATYTVDLFTTLDGFSMNRALLAAGLVDRLEVMVFPIITGESGEDPILADLPDIDLELVTHGCPTGACRSSSTRSAERDQPIRRQLSAH